MTSVEAALDERMIRFPLPAGFDLSRHRGELDRRISSKHPGWRFDRIEGGYAIAVPSVGGASASQPGGREDFPEFKSQRVGGIEVGSIPWPNNFEFGNVGQEKRLTEMVNERHGGGWVFRGADPAQRTLTFQRGRAQYEVLSVDKRTGAVTLGLPSSTKPSDGQRVCEEMEVHFPGFALVQFRPFMAQAVIAKITPAERNARLSIANRLGCRPWEVSVKETKDAAGGIASFQIELPEKYVESKHAEALADACLAIGHMGWTVDGGREHDRKATFIAGPLPEFDVRIDMPPGAPNIEALRLGRSLGGEGVVWNPVDSPWSLFVGGTKSGKSRAMALAAREAVMSGFGLAACDPFKNLSGLGFLAQYSLPGLWGCGTVPFSLEALDIAMTSMALLHAELQRRASIIMREGAADWSALSAEVRAAERIVPVMLLVDEATVLYTTTGTTKITDDMTDIEVLNAIKQKRINAIRAYLNDIMGTGRFVGISGIIGAQSLYSSNATRTMKANISSVLLLGMRMKESVRKVALLDPNSAPPIPPHIVNNQALVSGTGIAEMSGFETCVFRSYWSDLDVIAHELAGCGAPTTSQPGPTPIQIAKYTASVDSAPQPADENERDSKRPAKAKPAKGASTEAFDDWEPVLCDSCGTPIDDAGECACSR